MSKKALLTLIILLFSTANLFAESIFLKDGSIIEAKILRDTRYSVT